MKKNIQISTFDTSVDVMSLLNKMMSDVDVSAAADLARIGDYSAAQSILAGVTKETVMADPAGLDLLARISAQQGHIAEAEGYWRKARQEAGNDSVYEEPLHRLAAIQRRKIRTFLLSPALVILVAIFIFGLMVYWVSNQISGVGSTVAGLSITTTAHQQSLATLGEWSRSLEGRVEADASSTSKALGKITDQIAAMQTSVKRIERQSEKVGGQLSLNLDISGVTVTQKKGGSTLYFNAGLFERGLILSEGAREQIKAVSRALEPYADEITISVIGHSDNLPMPPGRRYGDNIGLGMARAMVVIGLLRQGGGLPSAILSARSDGEYKPPFLNDTLENRMRNRTVVISVSTRPGR